MACFLCNTTLESDELNKKIKCDSCNNRFCQSCSGLNSTETRVMQLAGKRTLKFVCEKCNHPTSSETQSTFCNTFLSDLRKEINSVTTSIKNELEINTSDMKNEITILRESNIQLIHLLSKDFPSMRRREPAVSPPLSSPSSHGNMVAKFTQNKTQILSTSAATSAVKEIEIIKEPIITAKQKPQWTKVTHRKKSKSHSGTSNDDADLEHKVKDAKSKKGKKIWLFISKVKDGVTQETIKDYVSKKCSSSSEVYVKPLDILKKSQDNNCFMIGVQPTFHSIVYQRSFWPKDVTFEKFDFRKGRRFLDDPRYSGPQNSNNSQEEWFTYTDKEETVSQISLPDFHKGIL